MEVGGEQLDQSEARVRVWLTAVKQRQGCQAGRKAGGNTVIKLCKWKNGMRNNFSKWLGVRRRSSLRTWVYHNSGNIDLVKNGWRTTDDILHVDELIEGRWSHTQRGRQNYSTYRHRYRERLRGQEHGEWEPQKTLGISLDIDVLGGA